MTEYDKKIVNSVKSNGVYSLKKGWLKHPERKDIPDVDMDAFDRLFAGWKVRYDGLAGKAVSSDDVTEFIEDLYGLRRKSIAEDGEYGLGNLVFKEFRNRGYLDRLRELRNELKSKELSLESVGVNQKPVSSNLGSVVLSEVVADALSSEFKDLIDYYGGLRSSIEPYSCGYIFPNGKILKLEEYHGEEFEVETDDGFETDGPKATRWDAYKKELGVVEYSSTHYEDFVIRTFSKRPTQQQFEQIEKFADWALDEAGYCKVLITIGDKQKLYASCSLFEGACDDYSAKEIVRKNWTGYDIVRLIKNYYV